MINLLFICLCFSSKLEMDEDGYVLERSFIKEELDFMVGYDNFQEINMQLFMVNKNFELSCIGNLVYLSREDLGIKINVKFLFEPNLINFDFTDTKATSIFIAKYELISDDDSSKKFEIRDLLTIKHVEKNNVVLNNDITDVYLINAILQLICISKFDEINYKPCIQNLFTRHEGRLSKLEQKMFLQHYHYLIGIKNLFKNYTVYKLFNKILTISSAIQEFEIEYLYKLIAFEITTLCDKIAPNEPESNTDLNTLSCVSYLLRILEMEAFFIHELNFPLFPTFICDPNKNMISAIKCRYSHKFFEEAFENKTNEEFYEVKSPKPEFFVHDVLIEHSKTKPLIHYIFVDRN